ncbi:MAG: helix-turn-helix domain-containing protein [Desulfomonilaceae bacterium]|jgi:transposase
MRKTFQYRAELSPSTEKRLNDWLSLCRDLYNACIEQRRDAWERCGKRVDWVKQSSELVVLKAEFPQYKGSDRYDSFTFPDTQWWSLDGRNVVIKKIGRLKLQLSRPIEGNIKTVTVKRSVSNRKKAQLAVAKCHEKITNQRKDFITETARQYVHDYGLVMDRDILAAKNILRAGQVLQAITGPLGAVA